MTEDRLTDEAAYLADKAWDAVKHGDIPEPRPPEPVREELANALQILQGVLDHDREENGEPFLPDWQDDLKGVQQRLRRALQQLEDRPPAGQPIERKPTDAG
jgi:hypothetical protein